MSPGRIPSRANSARLLADRDHIPARWRSATVHAGGAEYGSRRTCLRGPITSRPGPTASTWRPRPRWPPTSTPTSRRFDNNNYKAPDRDPGLHPGAAEPGGRIRRHGGPPSWPGRSAERSPDLGEHRSPPPGRMDGSTASTCRTRPISGRPVRGCGCWGTRREPRPRSGRALIPARRTSICLPRRGGDTPFVNDASTRGDRCRGGTDRQYRHRRRRCHGDPPDLRVKQSIQSGPALSGEPNHRQLYRHQRGRGHLAGTAYWRDSIWISRDPDLRPTAATFLTQRAAQATPRPSRVGGKLYRDHAGTAAPGDRGRSISTSPRIPPASTTCRRAS